MRVVGISGSLRAQSSNLTLLRICAEIAPPGMEIVLYDGLAGLPHFNPDLDGEGAVAPPPVAALRALLDGAQGIIVSSPEYAHGVPGSLKNGLDWLVSTEVLSNKPLVLMNAASSGGEIAQAALAETLRTMAADVLVGASLMSAFLRTRLVPGRIDPEVAAALRPSLAALAERIARRTP